jgi:hypothetical protein
MRAFIEGRAPMSVASLPLAGLATADADLGYEAIAPRRTGGFVMPNPRAAAVAVCAILAFGVVVGSVVSPAAESAPSTPVVVAYSPPTYTPPPAAAPAAVDDSAPVDNSVAVAPAAPAPIPPAQTIFEPAPAQSVTPPATPKPLPVPPLPPLPPVSHVFVVMLSGHGYNAAFGPNSQAPYLATTLPKDGELIPNYYGIAHGGLDNEVALISGQGPTKQTAANCPTYNDVTPGTAGDQGQAQGDGCVYPADTKTVADQLFALGDTWKAYVEDLSKGPGGCDHPAAGADDPNHDPRPDNASVTWRNPFLYFHSLIDSPACGSNMADLSQLGTDLQQVGDTPSLSYIVPDRCHDGSDTACTPGQPSGLASADAWLQTVIPEIEKSPGYKQGGLIAITFDAAPKDGPEADSSACCGQPDTYPNLPADDPSQQPDPNTGSDASGGSTDQSGSATTEPTTTDQSTTTTPDQQQTTTTPSDGTTTPPPVKSTGGGGKVGLLLISPYIKPNTVNSTGYYNHFSLFASIENLFATGNIAYANLPDLTTFDKTVYTAYQGGS